MAVSRRCPLLVVIDDLHWADASSRQLLAFLAGELTRAPLAVVATVRQHDGAGGDLEDLLGSLARERNSERLTLRGLGRTDVERYLQLTAGTTTTDPGLASALHGRTDGNPFFLIELVRLLTSERTIDQLGAGDATSLDVPASVRDTVHRRLARLPEDTQTLLRVAAVIGRRFDLELLGEAATLEPDRLVALVEPALAVGLVVEDVDTWSCRFSHALVRETLDASLSRLQRARIHQRVGEAIERRSGPTVAGSRNTCTSWRTTSSRRCPPEPPTRPSSTRGGRRSELSASWPTTRLLATGSWPFRLWRRSGATTRSSATRSYSGSVRPGAGPAT